jgi:hypothetical protein
VAGEEEAVLHGEILAAESAEAVELDVVSAWLFDEHDGLTVMGENGA